MDLSETNWEDAFKRNVRKTALALGCSARHVESLLRDSILLWKDMHTVDSVAEALKHPPSNYRICNGCGADIIPGLGECQLCGEEVKK